MTASIDVSETTPADGEPELVDGPVRNTWSRRWKPTLTEAGIALILGLAALLIFRWRADIGALDTSSPILYANDNLFWGNMIFNAQLGNVFTGQSLGAPLGQQIGLSAWGVEWVMMWITGHLAPGDNGPWLAMARYWQLTYVIAGVTTYLALRWISVRRSAAVIGALAFALVPAHEFQYSPFALLNSGVIPLVLALSFRLVSGSSFADLVPSSWTSVERRRRWLGLALVALVTLLAITAGNYLMVFNFFILGSSAVAMLVRRKWWVRAKRLGVAVAFSVAPLAIAYAPILLGRLLAGLSLSEDATSDRRAFAAYANGGDPFALLMPFRSGFVLTALEKIPVVGRFFEEYDLAKITREEYAAYFGGTIVVSALLILGLGALGVYHRKDLFRRSAPLSAGVKAVCLVGLLSILWYTRGAFGTFLAFILPQIRGYARGAVLVFFCATALLGLAATARRVFPKKIRILAMVLLSLGLLESISGTVPQGQVDPGAVALDFPIGRDEIDVQTIGFGISIKTPGPQGMKDLVAVADQMLPDGCTVLVLPLVKYPVDFGTGVVSFRSYDIVKPGILPSNLHWTSGGLTGTPNNAFVDEWLKPYRAADYSGLLQAADQAGYCGALFFDSLHESYFRAGVLNGSVYVNPSTDVDAALLEHYGKPCYAAKDAGVALYCQPNK